MLTMNPVLFPKAPSTASTAMYLTELTDLPPHVHWEHHKACFKNPVLVQYLVHGNWLTNLLNKWENRYLYITCIGVYTCVYTYDHLPFFIIPVIRKRVEVKVQELFFYTIIAIMSILLVKKSDREIQKFLGPHCR